MPDQCATCSATDVLLFTCGYCDRQYCADHVRTHQADCDEAAHTGDSDVNEEAAGFQWGTGNGTATVADAESATEPIENTGPLDEGGFQFESVGDERLTPRVPTGDAAAAVERKPRSTTDVVPSIRPVPRPVTGSTPVVERVPRRVDARRESTVERVPRSPDGDASPAVERVPWDPTGVHLRAVRRPEPRTPTGTATSAVRPVTEHESDPESAPEPEPTTTATPTSTTGAATASTTTDTATDGGAAAADAVPFRPMDLDRSPGSVDRSEPRTTLDWIRQQTYVSLTIKTALLATVINGALYFGMFVTLNGLF